MFDQTEAQQPISILIFKDDDAPPPEKGFLSQLKKLSADISVTNAETNEALESTDHDWALLLKTDECLESSDIDKVRYLIQNPLRPIYLFSIVDYPEGEDPPFSMRRPDDYRGLWQPRLVHRSHDVSISPSWNAVRFGNASEICCEPHRVSVSVFHCLRPGKTRSLGVSFDETVVGCNRVIQRNSPENWWPFYHESIAQTRMGRPDEALSCLIKANEIDPKNPQIMNNIAYNFMEKRDYDNASHWWEELVSYHPEFEAAFSNLGVLYMRKGDFATAAEKIKKAIALKNDTERNYYNLGNCLYRLGQSEESIQSYKMAIHFNPNYERALGELGAILTHENRLEEARPYIERALRLKDSSPTSRFNGGLFYFKVKDFERAAECFQLFKKVSADSPEVSVANQFLAKIQKLTA